LSRESSWIAQIWPRLAVIAGVLLLWWAVTASGLVLPELLPPPADVWHAFTSHLTGPEGLLVSAERSVLRLLIGMAVGVVLGTLIGLAVAGSVLVQRTLGSVMSALFAVPAIAWIPLALLWLDERTERAIILVVVIATVPAVAIGTAAAVRLVPPLLTRAARTLGAHGGELYRGVVLPAAVPGYLSALRQGWAFAWQALIAGELVIAGARGLGHLIGRAQEHSDTALILATIGVIVVIGLVVDLLFSVVDRRIRRRRGLLERPAPTRSLVAAA
jgi:NitT/TauT family transport system permease protein